MTQGKLQGESDSNALEVVQRIRIVQDCPFKHNIPLNRKLGTLPPIGENGIERPVSRTTLVIPEKNPRKRSPRLKMLERTITQQSPSHRNSISLNFSSTLPNHTVQKSSDNCLLQASLKDLRAHSPDQEILRSDDYIKSLLNQNRNAMMSVEKSFDKLCETLVSQHEKLLLSRRTRQTRAKTPLENTNTNRQIHKQILATDYSNISEKLSDNSSSLYAKKDELSTSDLGINRQNTFRIDSQSDKETEFHSDVMSPDVLGKSTNDTGRSGEGMERPKSAKYGRSRPRTGYGTRKEAARISMNI